MAVRKLADDMNDPGISSPPLPTDEVGRLRALHELAILDSPPDPSFDRLTRLACTIFQTPVAFVSFIDQSRQWFKSKEGPIQIDQTPRTEAICAYSILNDEVTVIPDAREDFRFRQNSLVLGSPGIRFYAAAPIKSRTGQNVGTLCIADSHPRRYLTEQEQQILRLLADLAGAAAEAHQRGTMLASNESEARDRYSLVARATLDGVWDWDMKKGIVYFSPRWQYILGLSEEDTYATTAHWLDRVHPQDRAMVDNALRSHQQGETARFRSEHRIRHGDGSWRWVVVRGLAQRNEAGLATRMAGSLTDITNERTSDSLTGLPNRLLLVERLAQLISRGQATHDWRFALLYADLNRFRQINDRIGHTGGDMVIRTIADRLVDTVGRTRASKNSMVCRFAGDEFVILLDGVKNSSQAYGIAERLHTVVAKPIHYDGERINAQASIGIAMAKPELDTPERFLYHSDLALLRAKAAGREASVLFDPIMQQETATRLELEDGLREAVALGQLRVHYQPQIELRNGKLRGCEALVRWQHPRRGLLAPSEFIGLAEELGFIPVIDSWVLKVATEQLAQWRKLPAGRNLTMSVNISGHTLSKRSLKYEVQALLVENEIPPASLCLELTESVLMQDLSESTDMMRDLHLIGVGLYMDDFGSGYSSFQYLSELPFDALKIDRSFMHRFPEDRKARTIVEGILALAITLGLKVVAEGIEDPMQAEMLKSIGCDMGQGFLFDRGLEADTFQHKYIGDAGLAAADRSVETSL